MKDDPEVKLWDRKSHRHSPGAPAESHPLQRLAAEAPGADPEDSISPPQKSAPMKAASPFAASPALDRRPFERSRCPFGSTNSRTDRLAARFDPPVSPQFLRR